MPTDPTRAGRDVHRKTWRDAPVRFFEAEAAGLRWLAEAERSGGARVARVIRVGDGFIELESVPQAPPTVDAAQQFGRALAATHDAGAPAFGAPPRGWQGDAWIGRQSQRNDAASTWGGFYAEQRVLPFVRVAVDLGNLDPEGARVVERVLARASDGVFDDGRPPARIHGDLWAGNVLWSPEGAVLIDPAAHGGHGLTDIAMLELFGCPGLDHVTAAWAEAAGMPADWHGLVGLHQLHPLAVHAVSHGPSYAASLVSVARRYA